MKCRTLFKFLGTALCGWFITLPCAHAQSNVFTYQGFLRDSNGAPASGNFQLQFKLRPAPVDTNQVGATLTNTPVAVSNGLFTTLLDFGAGPFDGSSRWLEIGVRTNGSTNAFFILSPTQPITATPYAIRAAVATSFLGGIADNQLSLNVPRLDTGGHFTSPVILDNGSGTFGGTLSGTFSGTATASGTFSGTLSGTFSGTGTGTFSGNGAGLTNLNVTNLVGVVQGNPNWQVTQTNIQQAVSSNNYITTNDALTTLILPNAPGVGTTLRISGSGAAGWTLAQNAGQSVFTGNLGLPAGRAWTARAASVGTNIAWKDIASSADGLKLVGVVGSGFIHTSTDGGFTWTQRGVNRAWVAAASSADGTRLAAAVGGSGFIFTSTDSGSNWTQRFNAHAWTDIASSADGTKLVATAGSENIYTSVDSGTNWTARASVLAWNSVASSADGVKLAAVVNGGAIFTSPDSGVTWSNRGGALAFTGITSSSDGIKLAACVNGSFLFTSGDSGVNWTPRAFSAAWQTISSSGDGINLVAAIGGAGTIYTSFDSGQTWIQRTTTNLAWQATTYSTDGTRVAAAVNVGQIFTSPSVTTVGTNGTLSGSQYSSVELQFVGNGLWIPLNATGKFTGN